MIVVDAAGLRSIYSKFKLIRNVCLTSFVLTEVNLHFQRFCTTADSDTLSGLPIIFVRVESYSAKRE